MSIIIRLQNLPWSANSVDIRRFFNGLSIPEGGVHIVGGEMGDAFIAFSTDEDARLAMAKDGGKIKDMQIKLLLSSRTEMMRVIEQARQQNMVVSQPHMVVPQPPILSALQPPSRLMPLPIEPERNERRRCRSPSPHHRSRDRSLGRDRRRSPDDRRGSKRDRSRSPTRSSRGFSREMDRRSDRFKRDDRRYDDSRYREDRRSARDPPEEPKKYPDADHVNSRSQLLEGFRDIPPVFDQVQNITQMTGMFQYGNHQQPHLGIQNFPDAFSRQQSDSAVQLSQAERVIPQKPGDVAPTGNQKHSSSDMYPHNQASFHSAPFELPISSSKENPVPPPVQQQAQKPRRRTRFEPETIPSANQPHFNVSESNTNIPKVEDQRQLSAYNIGRSRDNYSEGRGTWPREMAERSENGSWNEKRQPLLNPPGAKNGDFLQVVPMDLDPSPSDVILDNETYPENISARGPFPYAKNNVLSRNEDLRRENQNRGPSAHSENQNRGPPMHSENQNRGPIVHENNMVRGPHMRTDNQSRGPLMRDGNLNRGPPVHDDNQNRCLIDESLNRNPLIYNDNKNRRLPTHKDIQNTGPMYNVDQNRGPMYNENQNRGPPIHRDVQNRGSPMHNENQIRGPPMHRDVQNRGSPLHGENQNRGPLIHNDTQNRRSPVRDDIPGRMPPSMTLEVRGMSPDARIDDVLDLFRGIPLPAANIRIEASEKGFERAFIRFTSSSDFEEALSRNRSFIQEGRCELVPCPAAAFDSAPRHQKLKSKPKPREEDLTVQLRGLPFSCKDDDVVKFLDGLAILDLFVEIALDGRASGIGYVEFGSEKDFRAALAMNGKMIGHRYITVSVASKEMMAAGRGEDYIPKEPNANPRHSNSRPPHSPAKQGRPLPPPPPPINQGRQPPSCIFMKGLPEGVTNRDIADFLGQVSVMPRAIHIMLRPDKMPSGEAYAEFATTSDMEAAVQMSGKLMAGNRVLIQPISFYEMSEILGRPAPIHPLPGPGALLRTPNDVERPRRPLIPEGPNDILFRERPLMEPPVRGGRPLLGNMERPASRSSFGPNRMRGPWLNRPRQEGRFPPPSIDRGLKDFGSPGCVVSIKNLHFRAGLEELLDFFQDYKVTKDNIFRRYNENGQTTGEARVALSSPRDAQQVVRELNQKPIMGRPLTLSIL